MAKQPRAIANGIAGERPPPGLTSLARAMGDSGLHEGAGRGEARQAQVEGGRGQQGGGAAGSRPGPSCPGSETNTRWSAERRAHLRGQLGAAGLDELVGVDAQAQAAVAGGLEDAAALRDA